MSAAARRSCTSARAAVPKGSTRTRAAALGESERQPPEGEGAKGGVGSANRIRAPSIPTKFLLGPKREAQFTGEGRKRLVRTGLAGADRSARRRATVVLERSRRIAKDHEGSRRISMDREGSRRISKDLERSRRSSKDLEGSRWISKDLAGSRRIAKDLAGSRRIAKNLERSRRISMDLDGSRRISKDREG